MNLIDPQKLQTYIANLDGRGITSSQRAAKLKAINDFIAWAFRKGHITKELMQQLMGIIAKHTISKVNTQSHPTPYKALTERTPPHLDDFFSKINHLKPQFIYSMTLITITILVLIGSILLGTNTKAQNTIYRSPTTTRKIAFEGQLTDKDGIPIIKPSRGVFRLYSGEKSIRALYDSSICELFPDNNGYIQVIFGSGCGKSVNTTILSQYPQLYLGITVNGGSEFSPRTRIPTVSYAMEAQTLGGYMIPEKTATYSASLLARENEVEYAARAGNIPVINDEGNLVIAAENPRVWSTTGTFQLRGQALSITTQEGSAGSITIAPDIGGNVLIPTGNVGIATAEPMSFRLQVAGDIGPDVDGIFTLGSRQKEFKAVYAEKFYGDGSNLTGIPQLFQEKNGSLAPQKVSSDILLGSNDSKTARIKLSGTGDSYIKEGSFGIGTTAPSSLFEVIGTGQIRGTSGKAGLYVDKRGFVAIGTTNPSVDLDVGGEFKVTGRAILGDSVADTLDIYAGSWILRHPSTLDLADSQVQAFNIEGGLLNLDTNNSRVGIGTSTPSQKLHVSDSKESTTVVLIENTQTGSDADGLSIQLGFTGSGSTNNHFTTFLNGDGALQGRIQSNGSGGITYSTSGSDFAEYFLLSGLVDSSELEPGTLICQYPDGGVGPCDEKNRYIIGATSDAAGFVGGAQYEGNTRAVLVGLMGQLNIKVTDVNGQVHPGDPLTTSTTRGRAQKATAQGRIVGFAQTEPEGSTVFATILPSYYDPRLFLTNQGEVSPTARLGEVYEGTMVSSSMFSSLDTTILHMEQNIEDTAQTVATRLPQLFIESLDSTIIYSKTVASELIQAQKAVITSLSAEEIDTNKLTSEQIHTMRLHTNELSAQTATIAGTLQTDTLAANSASIAGTLTADVVSSKNIKELEQRLAESTENQHSESTNNRSSYTELMSSIGAVQKNIAQLSQGVPAPVSESPALNTISDDLTVYGSTTLFDTHIMGTLIAGDLSITQNSIISLSDNLSLNALNSIDLLDGTLVVSRNGTVTINGTLLARDGIRTNSIRGLTDGDNVNIELTGKDRRLSINQNGAEVAAIDGYGNAHFGGISLDSFLEASAEATLIADSSTHGDTLTASIQTDAKAAGVATLPAYARRVVIYNERITDNALIYLSPTSDTKNKTLFVTNKQSCTTENPSTSLRTSSPLTTDTCTRSFTVAVDGAIDTDVTFNWWIIN